MFRWISRVLVLFFYLSAVTGCVFQETQPVQLIFSIKKVQSVAKGGPVKLIIVEGDALIICSAKRITMFRRGSVWQRTISAPFTAVICAGQNLAVFLKDKKILLLDKKSGKILQKITHTAWTVIPPVYKNKKIWFADQLQRLWVWDLKKQPQKLMQSHYPFTAKPVYKNGRIWIGSYNRSLFSIAVNKNNALKHYLLPARPDTPLMFIGDSQAIFIGRNRCGYLMDIVTGNVTKSFTVRYWSDAVRQNETRIYYLSRSNRVGVIEGQKGVRWSKQYKGQVYIPVESGVWAGVIRSTGVVDIAYRLNGILCGRFNSKKNVTGQPVAGLGGILLPCSDGVYLLRWNIAPGQI